MSEYILLTFSIQKQRNIDCTSHEGMVEFVTVNNNSDIISELHTHDPMESVDQVMVNRSNERNSALIEFKNNKLLKY